MTELKEILSQLDRYKGFTILDKPIKFNEFMADKNIDIVQTHSAQIYNTGVGKDIAGFCGQFAWKDNEIIPLDGDSYNKEMTVLGYEWWSTDEVTNGLDILVGPDW